MTSENEIQQTATIHYALIDVWIAWCNREGIPAISADDLLIVQKEYGGTEQQRRFTETYCRLWSLEND